MLLLSVSSCSVSQASLCEATDSTTADGLLGEIVLFAGSLDMAGLSDLEDLLDDGELSELNLY